MKNDPDTPDFGLNPGELRLVTVGPEWALRFSAERDRLSTALGPVAIDIQHVGSTAVPGILAKPILDIAVAIQSFENGYPLVPLLEALGYEYRGEYGIPLRHYFVHGIPRRTHHLHVLEQQSTDWERHIRFRDQLRRSPATAAQYSELKLASVSESSGSRDLYQSLKSSFITKIQGPDARA
ncbi:GrpB family protein [Pseudoxanthomonas mexicana]